MLEIVLSINVEKVTPEVVAIVTEQLHNTNPIFMIGERRSRFQWPWCKFGCGPSDNRNPIYKTYIATRADGYIITRK